MTEATGVLNVLGWSTPAKRAKQSPSGLVQLTRKGLPFKSIKPLMDQVGISREELGVIVGIPHRTFVRRSQQHHFSPEETDRILRLARVVAMANETFGSADKARSWMHRKNGALQQATPLSLLDTDAGTQMVTDVLGRIEHGIFE